MDIKCKLKSIDYNLVINTAVLVFVLVAGLFNENGCLYTVQNDMWCKLGRDLLHDFSNINKETLSWAYDAGLANLWVNHEFLTCMLMGACSYVSNYFFAIICYIMFFMIIIVEFIKNIKENRGGNFVFYALTVLIFAKFANVTGFARPSAFGVLIYLVFLLVISDIFIKDIDNKRFLSLIVILILWSCCHGGSYPIGAVTIIAFVIEDLVNTKKVERAIAVILTYIVTTFGILMVPVTRNSILYNFIQHSNTEEVDEWVSITGLQLSNKLTIFIMVAISIVTIILQYRLHRKDGRKTFLRNIALIIMLSGTFIMGCLHVRYLQYYGCVGLILIPRYVNGYEKLDKKTITLSRIVITLSSLLFMVFLNCNIFKQQKNAYDWIEINKEHGIINYDENFISTLLDCGEYRVINLQSGLDDILVNNDIKLFHDGRCDNMYKEPFHNMYVLYNITFEHEDERDNIKNALKSVREYNADILNIRVRNDNKNDFNDINWIMEQIGGNIDIIGVTPSDNMYYSAYLLKINY